KEHPRSEQAEEAKAGLASLEQGSGADSQVLGKTPGRRDAAPQPTHRDVAAMNGAPDSVPVLGSAASGGSSLPAMAQTSGANPKSVATERPAVTQPTLHASPAKDGAPGVRAVPGSVADGLGGEVLVAADVNGAKRSGKRAVVTGIRHWSTATYTRVAIDLGDNVTYEAARVPNPDRIYFDLHGTRLAPELVGKSFAVTDDGFLKRVRAAQYTDDVTRVVLDVNDVTEYSAFLLPNPYRLIIDIHGGKGAGSSHPSEQRPLAGDPDRERGTGNSEPTATADVPAPRVAATVKATAARPVPNTVATKSASAT